MFDLAVCAAPPTLRRLPDFLDAMKLSTFIPFGVVLAAFAADALVIQNRDAPSVVSLPFERNPAASSSLVRYRRTRQILDDLSQSRPLLYTVTLQIGTPPQTVQLQLDTGSGDLVVETPSSDLCAANPQVCAVQGTCEHLLRVSGIAC